MTRLIEYARELFSLSGTNAANGELFAKILTPNDDAGRHGVLIPTEAYPFLPEFEIVDPTKNATRNFYAFNAKKLQWMEFAYKYYERYPERRVTRLPSLLNAVDVHTRILVILKAKNSTGQTVYIVDCLSSISDKFSEHFKMLFGSLSKVQPGQFVITEISATAFSADDALNDLLTRFDTVKAGGWTDTLRQGPTGIGFTFETMIGIKENNNQTADFRGIEIKCKGKSAGESGSSGKINLFQLAPTWASAMSLNDRIKTIGKEDSSGLFACYSAINTNQNNLGLLLEIATPAQKIVLRKYAAEIGSWPWSKLGNRLLEKHSRAVFVTATKRESRGNTQYKYEELLYCERPSIERFLQMFLSNQVIFEFTMHERGNGTIRNHGYPWRINRSDIFDRLFAFQIKLRS